MITRENAKEWLPLVQAMAEGETIQEQMPITNEWISRDELRPEVNPLYFRIAPEPKRVPLTAEDIPAVCWVQWPSLVNDKPVHLGQLLVVGVNSCFIAICSDSGPLYYSFLVLLEQGAEYSSDRKNWKPCWKEVAQ